MASEFRLPDIGEGLTEAAVLHWHVAVGEPVGLDQPLVEVETDKSVVELPSPYAGTVLHHGAGPGEQLPVGAVLAVIGAAGETWPAAVAGQPAGAAGGPAAGAAPIVGRLVEQAQDLTRPAPGLPAPPSQPPAPPSQPPAPPSQLPVPPAAAPAPPQPVPPAQPAALPLVRKLARELGVDLGSVPGTGPGGTISRADVLAAARATAAAPAGPPPEAGAPPRDERRPLSPLRRTIAANLSRAWAEIPLVTAFDEVEVSRLLAARAALQSRHGVRVPIDALVAAAVVPALRAYPDFNATLDGDTLVLHGRQHLGVAVDTPDGLLVAVIEDAGSLGLLQLAAEVCRLGAAARARALTRAELSGQTFTISNIGALGGGHGTPLVPPGTVGILSVGRVAPRPVARGSTVEVAPVMPLSLSYDHRVIDGGVGRRFLTMLTEHLAEPVLFLA
jgi:pyruvate/2-oxoglutarate dehydrogenase complex dihydrolipoamide acyltransferase (E2) component